MEKIILGIDPGTNVMGYGLLQVRDRKPQLIAMGVLKMKAVESHYLRLRRIYERVSQIITEFHPDELAIESPYMGINPQTMVKLCRGQGAAICAAVEHDLPVFEYPPATIKMAIVGNGNAAKEQVRAMLQRSLKIGEKDMVAQLDASDALAAALCHFHKTSSPLAAASGRGTNNWKQFLANNQGRVHKNVNPLEEKK